MKFATFTYKPEKPEGFDFSLLRVKPETGIRIQPDPTMHSNIAVFADTATGKVHPDWVSQSELGPAKFGNYNYNIYWDVLCPTQPEYQAEQLDYIEEVSRMSKGIWLNSQYFADHGHCTCPRCKERFQKSGLSWEQWRRKEVTDYIAQIRERVKGDLVLCLQPDPVSSLERYGVDFDDFAKYADAFCVVMFSKNYATPWYWEMITRGFKKQLKKPFYISLYIYGPGDLPQDVPTTSELLTVSVRCVRVGGIEGILYLVDSEKEAVEFQKQAVENTALRQRLRAFGGAPVQEYLDRVASWENIVK
ncbi:MAG: hypothetical protein NWF01_03670 [Candidatus Bathyarchaeota archaeon]|nr:hypothetical protein [Candidatus Bathyarchaeota archaeon]